MSFNYFHDPKLSDRRNNWSSPIVVDQFFSESEIKKILEYRDNCKCMYHKDADGRAFDVFMADEEAFPSPIHSKLEKYLKRQFKIKMIRFLNREAPFHLHSHGAHSKEERPYKVIVISLDSVGEQGHFYAFDQRGLEPFLFTYSQSPGFDDRIRSRGGHVTVSFRDIETNVNLLNFDGPGPTVGQPILNELAHIDPNVLSKMSLERKIDHQFNRAIIIDSCQFHCSAFQSHSEYFQSRRITIFTEYDDE